MDEPTEARRLRIFVGESEKRGRVPLYEVIVEKARCRGLAGATVTRGITGFGRSRRVHAASILRLSEGLPLVVEIVDEPERIEAFLPELQEIVSGEMVVLEKVQAIAYRRNRDRGSATKGSSG